MDARTVPEDQWIDFVDGFSRDHRGWPATIEMRPRQHGAQTVAKNLPLLGMSFDTKGTRPSSLEIVAGENPERHVSHRVDMPLYIREAAQSDGSVEIEI